MSTLVMKYNLKRQRVERLPEDLWAVLVEQKCMRYSASDIYIDKPMFTIGRSLDNDKAIMHGSLSAHHCTIVLEPEGSWLIMNDGPGFTKINDVPLPAGKFYRLRNDDFLEFGSTKKLFYKFTENEPTAKRVRKHDRIHDADSLILVKIERTNGSEIGDDLKENQSSATTAQTSNEAIDDDSVLGRIEDYWKDLSTQGEIEPAQARKDQNNLVENVVLRKWGQNFVNGTNFQEWNHRVESRDVGSQTDDTKNYEESCKKYKEQLKIYYKQLSIAEAEKVRLIAELDQEKRSRDKAIQKSNAQIVDKVHNIMIEQLKCSICSEIFITPVTMNCAHTFCQHCITTWLRDMGTCPECRTSITFITRCLVLANYIDELFGNLSEEYKNRRKNIIEDRTVEVEMSNIMRPNGSSLEGESGNTMEEHIHLELLSTRSGSNIIQRQIWTSMDDIFSNSQV